MDFLRLLFLAFFFHEDAFLKWFLLGVIGIRNTLKSSESWGSLAWQEGLRIFKLRKILDRRWTGLRVCHVTCKQVINVTKLLSCMRTEVTLCMRVCFRLNNKLDRVPLKSRVKDLSYFYTKFT